MGCGWGEGGGGQIEYPWWYCRSKHVLRKGLVLEPSRQEEQTQEQVQQQLPLQPHELPLDWLGAQAAASSAPQWRGCRNTAPCKLRLWPRTSRPGGGLLTTELMRQAQPLGIQKRHWTKVFGLVLRTLSPAE